ncbi:MAG TPA: hypothetical protein VNJ02_20640 [Vicinamibacterales bacterium]|nr:hypothetical protein [Vicinamibacterales bacterium]
MRDVSHRVHGSLRPRGIGTVRTLAHLRGILLVGLVLFLVNGLGGLLLGWIFWRWGLPYAILCHFVAGILIQALGPRVLA